MSSATFAVVHGGVVDDAGAVYHLRVHHVCAELGNEDPLAHFAFAVWLSGNLEPCLFRRGVGSVLIHSCWQLVPRINFHQDPFCASR